jgi:hypothetical protein
VAAGDVGAVVARALGKHAVLVSAWERALTGSALILHSVLDRTELLLRYLVDGLKGPT